MGVVNISEAYDYSNSEWKRLTKKPCHNPLVVTLSNTRQNVLQDKYVTNMGGTSVLAGGSGRKVLLLKM